MDSLGSAEKHLDNAALTIDICGLAMGVIKSFLDKFSCQSPDAL
jgi:hypothetical protein